MNAVEIEAAISELALQPFDAAEFPFGFLAAFGSVSNQSGEKRANCFPCSMNNCSKTDSAHNGASLGRSSSAARGTLT